MTQEEAVEKLKILKEDYWDDDGFGHESKLYDDTVVALDMAIKALEERKTGKWILVEMGDTDLYKCSLCGSRKRHNSPFCPNCGAKMEGAE